ncbi:MAG: PRC-barrel domain-containing protein [Alphaproteobacteria bacterium]
MIKGTHLIGRAVIDMEAAERLGRIKEIIVQRDGERVAGFIVAHGETIVGTGGTRRTIPASALHAIGPDAVTVHGSEVKERASADLGNLPRMSDVIGRKMLTRSGRLLGSISDVLINGDDGTIIGFAVGESVRSKLENILNPQRSKINGYVRADADLHVGNELIVVPDNALIEGEPGAQETAHKSATEKTDETGPRGWSDSDPAQSSGPGIWMRRTEAAKRDASQKSAEIRLESETARLVEESRVVRPSEERPETSPPLGGSESVRTFPEDQPPK